MERDIRNINIKINEELRKHTEENVFPEYDKNEKAHNIDHIKDVIRRSFDLVNENDLDVNCDMVYTISSYHDIAHHIDSKTHEVLFADMISKDKQYEAFLKEIRELLKDKDKFVNAQREHIRKLSDK